MAGTTFPKRLKPLFVYNFHRCVGNNHKIVQACGDVCCSGCGGVRSCSDDWGRREDATTSEGMGWSNEGEKIYDMFNQLIKE